MSAARYRAFDQGGKSAAMRWGPRVQRPRRWPIAASTRIAAAMLGSGTLPSGSEFRGRQECPGTGDAACGERGSVPDSPLVMAVDVIVIGGGPAGSSCARTLVRGGARVAVVDRAEFPRVKLCAGWLSAPIW